MTIQQYDVATRSGVCAQISTATAEDLDVYIDAIRRRRKDLTAIRSADVRSGSEVKTAGMSPKYLNGLTGTVTEITGQRCTLLLDPHSQDMLRGTKFAYQLPHLRGIPKAGLVVLP